MFTTRIYLAVAALLAVAAFIIGQFVPGAGMMFAILAATMWVSCSIHRSRAVSCNKHDR